KTLSSYKNSISMYEKQTALYIEQKTKLQTTINNINKEINEINSLEQSLAKDILLNEELVRVLQQYLLSIFEDTLEQISEKASQMLSQIPNMAAANIQYLTEKSNQKGEVKREITPYISLDGEMI